MDEQRFQAYIELIEQLLNCVEGEETKILQQQSELVDAGLLAVIQHYTDLLKQQGNPNAGWLRHFAQQLTTILDSPNALIQEEPENATQFLGELLLLVAESQGNEQQFYGFLTQYQEYLNETLLQTLPEVAAVLLSDSFEHRQSRAALLSRFGNLIQQFPLGQRWLNLELSITAYQQALAITQQAEMPAEWAETMNNLAVAYSDRIRGDRAENIELAIKTYRLALTVRTQTGMPVEWAETMNNLATAYSERIQGDHAENIELAIKTYQQAMMVMTQKAIPVEWARIMSNLAIAYRKRIRGDRAENIELALSAFQQALTVRTQTEMRIEWAQTMMNLATAYYSRIRGDRAENIELAIDAYQQTLTVITQTAMPVEWASTMMNLATAYYSRIRGDRAENIELAIDACQQALAVRTQATMPVMWAQTMMNLAIAYRNRVRGDRAENIEQAIDACQQALTVRTQTAMPIEWAQTMMNLANAYYSRIRGDRAENIEQAIDAYQQALTVMTQTAMPVEWASTMMNLANAHSDRIRGDRAENIEQAIDAYQQALTVMTQTAMPMEWAFTMMNLAISYTDRIRGDRAENIEQAIDACQQAFIVMTQAALPAEWAKNMMNLANAYYFRVRGDRAENIELAIDTYQEALTVMTQTTMPVEWAQSMNNLATAYSENIRGDQNKNIEQAIFAYQYSLEIYEPELFPSTCRKTARNLGNLYFDQKRWQAAVLIYQKALQAAETLYQSASLFDSKAAELAETGDLPRRAAYALARSGDLQTATLTVEQGRARGLSETLERDRSNLSQLQQTHSSLFTQYQETIAQLHNLEVQQRLRMTSEERHSLTPEALRSEALRLRQTLTEIIEQIRNVEGYTDFLAQPDFDDIQQAVHPNIPLVYLVPTPAGSLALIVTQDGITDLWLDDLTETRIMSILNNWFSVYGDNQQKQQIWAQIEETHPAWQTFQANQSVENRQVWLEIKNNHPAFQEAKKRKQAWLDTINQATHELWQPLMAPLIDHLRQHLFQQATLIPTGYLSLLPLHAAWTEGLQTFTDKRERYALDEILFTYAPNARSSKAAADIAQRTGADSILAIDNPLQDLPNASSEVTAVIARFPQHKVLKHKEATIVSVLTTLPHYSILHLSCHGIGNLSEPLISGLVMSDGFLTLRDILDLRLSEQAQGGIRLAVLSACETGLAGVELADEAISLPTGLLQAGVAAVIASLWSVDDRSTMILLTRFYDLWRKEGLAPAVALRQAQQWVRDTTSLQKAKYFESTNPDMFRSLILLAPDHFAHPFHWAAFSYIGV